MAYIPGGEDHWVSSWWLAAIPLFSQTFFEHYLHLLALIKTWLSPENTLSAFQLETAFPFVAFRSSSLEMSRCHPCSSWLSDTSPSLFPKNATWISHHHISHIDWWLCYPLISPDSSSWLIVVLSCATPAFILEPMDTQVDHHACTLASQFLELFSSPLIMSTAANPMVIALRPCY